VPPHIAQQWDIPAGCPTFLSSQTYRADPCPDHTCLATYSPLEYRVGQVTEAQHFHDHIGGIAFYRLFRGHGPLPSWAKEQTGWAAFVEPIGTVLLNEGLGINREGRASAVRVLQIVPWCKLVMWELRKRWRHPAYCHQPHVLESGLLCSAAYSKGTSVMADDIDDELLIPCCMGDVIPPRHVYGRFALRDDGVIFHPRPRSAIWNRRR
jgi:hypothetical protein